MERGDDQPRETWRNLVSVSGHPSSGTMPRTCVSPARPRLRYRPSFPFSSGTLAYVNDAGNNAANVPRLSSAVLVSGSGDAIIGSTQINALISFFLFLNGYPCSLNRVLTFSLLQTPLRFRSREYFFNVVFKTVQRFRWERIETGRKFKIVASKWSRRSWKKFKAESRFDRIRRGEKSKLGKG